MPSSSALSTWTHRERQDFADIWECQYGHLTTIPRAMWMNNQRIDPNEHKLICGNCVKESRDA